MPASNHIEIETDECCCGSGMGDCGHAFLTVSGDEEVIGRIEAYARAQAALTAPEATK